MNRLSEFISDVNNYPNKHGKWVKLAVKKFEQEIALANEGKGDYIFRPEKAERVIGFIEKLRQTEGAFAGKRFNLFPFQVFILCNIFGWFLRSDPTARRYRRAYISMARKNGKSALISGIALYMLMADGESASQGYCAANSREQAENVFRQCKNTISATPGLSKYLTPQTYNILHKKSYSFLRKASSEAGTAHGGNVSFAVIDELHRFKNGELYTAYLTGMGIRKNALLFAISTAGVDKSTYGYKEEEYAKALLTGEAKDDTYFSCIFSIDEEDAIDDESCWIKANPTIDVVVSRREMQSFLARAKVEPVFKQEFIAYNLNRYVTGNASWMSEDVLTRAMEAPVSLDELSGLDCYVGFDASQKHDFTCYSLTFPEKNFYTIWRYFLPGDNFRQRVEFENSNYLKWVEDGFLTLTPGEVIDYQYIYEQLKTDHERFNIRSLYYDPWKSFSFLPQLEEIGIKAIEFKQSLQNMAPAVSQLTLALLNKSISLEANPISLWCLNNATIKPDINGNSKFIKPANQKKRIDGAVVLAMSYYRAWLATSNPVKEEEKKPAFFGVYIPQ